MSYKQQLLTSDANLPVDLQNDVITTPLNWLVANDTVDYDGLAACREHVIVSDNAFM